MEIGKEIPEGKAAGLRSPWPPRLWAFHLFLDPLPCPASRKPHFLDPWGVCPRWSHRLPASLPLLAVATVGLSWALLPRLLVVSGHAEGAGMACEGRMCILVQERPKVGT